MHRSPTGNLVLLDLEIEATLRRSRAERRRKLLQDRIVASILEEETHFSDSSSPESPSSRESATYLPEVVSMADEHQQKVTLEDYSSSSVPQFFTGVARSKVQAHNINYPHSLIHLIQGNLFQGLPNEDPYAHLATFIEICNTVKLAGVPDEAIRLSLFSFSLAGEAKRWLHSFKGSSLKTWEEVVEKFLKKYFPESKTAEGKAAISSFYQFPDESLSEALEKFRGFLRKTPTHGFSEPIQLNMFIDGLRPQTKQLLDSSAGGKIKLKTPEEAIELIENMSASDHAIMRDRVHQTTKKILLELSSHDALLAQNKLLSKKLEILTEILGKLPTKLSIGQPTHSSVLQVTGCTICGEAHEIGQCIPIEEHTQEVHYMGNQQRQGYTQGGPYNQQGQWRSHPDNQFNKDQGGPSNKPIQQGPNIFQRTNKLEETLTQFMQVTMSNHKSTESALKNLEVQVGQLAKQIADKSSNNFVANT
ncbi:hypothetical protein GmHk_12G035110 [Glycine max]|nr:hypothetical protein GmHk_12G035110 [Glycine max]